MDSPAAKMYFSIILLQGDENMGTLPLPIYGLYGELGEGKSGFDLHCETITARSRPYHFEIGQHMHRSFLQMLLVEKGEGDATVPEGSLRLSPGTLVTIPPMCPHGFRFSPDTEGLVITLDADAPAAREVRAGPLAAWFETVRVLMLGEGEEGRRLLAALRDIAGEFEQRIAGRDALLDSLAKTALILAARQGLSAEAELVPSAGDQRREQRLGQLIHQHFREHRPVAFYASALGLSPAQFNRFVRQRFAASPHELLARRLIDQACRDLIFTEMPVSEIAYSLGFSDPSYFFRFFQRHAGATPRAYRQTERTKRAY